MVHSVFPNLSISAILGGQCLIGFIFPGETSTTTMTRQLILSAKAPATDQEAEEVETFSQMTLQAVRDEDYALVATVQNALHSGANDSFLIGRNEPAVQHYPTNPLPPFAAPGDHLLTGSHGGRSLSSSCASSRVTDSGHYRLSQSA